jgi:hypothetical protein
VNGPGMSRAARLVLWIPPLVWMGVIFRVSAIPGTQLPGGGYSTPGHFVGYAILGGLLVLPLRRSLPIPEAIVIAVIIASLYGMTDEFHQSFVPMRTPDVVDWGVDTLGAFAGALAATWLASTAQRRLVRRAERA